ncbi:MAG: hypothetical protein ACYDA3_10100 [Gaiellaceae bacterium]
MSDTGNDEIEFDFFDEPDEETVTQRRRAVRPPTRPAGRPRGPRRPAGPPAGLTPLLRLVGLVAAAILLVVLLVFWVQSCQSNAKANAYKGYLRDVGQIAAASHRIGSNMNDDLTTPGIKVADLASKLDQLALAEQQDVTRANGLNPPGHLRDANQHLIEALEFRVSGLKGLADAFRSTANTKNSDRAGTLLAQQAERLVASDVIWQDLFKAPATAILASQNITGVAVPDSVFVQSPDLANSHTFAALFKNVQGASTTTGTATGLHGTGIVDVKALPSGKTLSPSSDNTVVASTSLAFQVDVKDTGGNLESKIPVTLTIQKTGAPIVLTQTISVINPGETKAVIFKGIDTTGVFGVRTQLKVYVQPVPQEHNIANNSAQYPVIFSLTP